MAEKSAASLEELLELADELKEKSLTPSQAIPIVERKLGMLRQLNKIAGVKTEKKPRKARTPKVTAPPVAATVPMTDAELAS